jgi:VIT1/CCC1 family predicted Fe2+/Mn2+ transporter
MMKFELNLERPLANRSWISALTIGSSYFFGGVIPLLPYALTPNADVALLSSCCVTLFALFIFGYIKSRLLGTSRPFLGALQMTFVGALAAGAAYGVARAIPQQH